VAALAYVLLPVSGLAAYLTGRSPRVRFHGLQAVTLGLAWPVALYACTYVTPGATQVCALVGAVVWLGFLLATALGLDPRIPLAGRYLEEAARDDPKAAPETNGEEPGD
jgi:uncharacterized membrane protein